jgi:hypothetical protein
MRDELIMDSDVKFYTYLINHYKLVTPEKADAETSFFEKSEKEIFYRLKGQP